MSSHFLIDVDMSTGGAGLAVLVLVLVVLLLSVLVHMVGQVLHTTGGGETKGST